MTGADVGANPLVDLIVAVHDPTRPIERAVASALNGNPGIPLRVSVVVHNTDAQPIRRRLGGLAHDPRTRVLELHDGIRSPAGPFNLGLEHATGTYTSVMGSDDVLDPGAVTSWARRAQRVDADVVIARTRLSGGRAVPTPPTRPFRRSHLDPIKDRLSYRSAPLGLVSRARFGTLRFAAGLPVGEDVPYVLRLWFSDAHVAYDRWGPAYRIHEDALERTTVSPRPIASELAHVTCVTDDTWFRSLDPASRDAIGTKILRVHVFGAVANRQDTRLWTIADRQDLARFVERVLDFAPGAAHPLAASERAALDLTLASRVPVGALIDTVRRRRMGVGALVPRQRRSLFAREAPVRMATASVLQLL